jgi:hypothetical protein
MIDDDQGRPVQFRLAWRWKASGVSGEGPWMHRGEVVEGWLESLSRRTGERVEHWIEVSSTRSEGKTERPSRRESRHDRREVSSA